MKILLADSLAAPAEPALAALCDELVIDASLEGPALAEACKDADILVVRSTKVPADILDAAEHLALIVRGGAGVNTIDVAHAAKRGIFVANTPGRNAIAVAELAMGLMLSLDRRIADNVSRFRDGEWAKKEFARATGLAGRTLGIVGLGQIGSEVARRANAFGLHVIAWSREPTKKEAAALGADLFEDLDVVLEASDIVSIHLPMNEETRGLFDRDRLMRLRTGAMLLNTARAGIIDTAALLEAIEARQLWVGLDVIPDEPAASDKSHSSPLADHPRIYVTHHIGASTRQAQEAVAAEVVRVIEAFIERGEVPNCVNLCLRSPATHQLIVRHEDRVGVLAAVLGAISHAGVNAEELDNRIFEGAHAACCFIRLDAEPPAALVEAIRELPHVIDARVSALH